MMRIDDRQPAHQHGDVVHYQHLQQPLARRIQFVLDQLVAVDMATKQDGTYQYAGVVTAVELRAGGIDMYSVKALNGASNSGRYEPNHLMPLDEYGQILCGITHLVRIKQVPGWPNPVWVAADDETSLMAERVENENESTDR